MKIVVDTNVLISALISPNGTPAQILNHEGTFHLFTSEEIMDEVERVLHYERIQKRYKLSDQIIAAYLKRLRAASVIIEVAPRVDVVRDDPDDNKFLACAETCRADYIVSGDPHLLDLGSYQEIPIITPGQFREILSQRGA